MSIIPIQPLVLLDGATGSNLIDRGLPPGECVEKWILENPDILVNLQKEFIEAGSDIIYAPTFSANRAKLEHFDLADKTQEFNRELVKLSRRAVSESGKKVLVAGDISPTGEFAEPFGEMSFKEMTEIFEEQARAQSDAGVDLYVIETMMSLIEIRAAVIACKKFNKPIFVTVTVDEHGRTLTGATALSCLITLQEMGIAAYGLNCSHGADKMADIIKELMPFAKIPIIAKPNAGQPDEDGKYNLTPEKMAEDIIPLLEYGVTVLGGCCGNTPDHIKAIRKEADSFDFNKVNIKLNTEAFILSNETQVFFLSDEGTENSEPIECSIDMADELLELSDTSIDVITVAVNSEDDAYQFSQNMHMARLPIMFKSESEEALTEALFYYNGRAMIDSHCGIEKDTLKHIADVFGALVF